MHLQLSPRHAPSYDFVRGLSPFERAMHLVSISHPTHFCVVIEIEGRRSHAAFRHAFDEILNAHPILSTCIIDGQDGPAFFRADSEIPVRFMDRSDVPDWSAVVRREIAAPFDPGCAPLLRATVIEGDDGMVVVLCAYHAVSDGMSLTFIADDLMAALSGAVLPVRDILASTEDLCARQLPAAIDAVAPSPEIAEAERTSPASAPLRWSQAADSLPGFETLALAHADTARLLDRTRAERTTVHGAVSAALSRALLEMTGRSTHMIFSPLDMRRALPFDTRTCAMMFGGFGAAVDATADFWSMARHAVDGIAAARSPEAFIGFTSFVGNAVLPDASTEMGSAVLGAMIGEHMLSNLGMVGITPRRGDLHVRAFWGPACAVHLEGYQFLGLATLEGVLRMVNTGYDLLPGLLPAIGRQLVQASN